MIATPEQIHKRQWQDRFVTAVCSLYKENNCPERIANHLLASKITFYIIEGWPVADAPLLWRVYKYSTANGEAFKKLKETCEWLFRRWASATAEAGKEPWQKLGRKLVISDLVNRNEYRACGCGVLISDLTILRKTVQKGGDFQQISQLICPQCNAVLLLEAGPTYRF